MKIFEVFVSGKKRASKGDTVIGYKQWVWILDDDNFEEVSKDIFTKLKITDQDIVDSRFDGHSEGMNHYKHYACHRYQFSA